MSPLVNGNAFRNTVKFARAVRDRLVNRTRSRDVAGENCVVESVHKVAR